MGWLTENSTLPDTFSTYFNFNVTYKIITALFVAILFRKLISKPKSYKLFPIWATIEIAIASFILQDGLGRRIYSSISRYGGSLFGVTSTHQVVADLPGVDRLMSQSFHVLNAEPVQYTLFTRVFGGVDSPALKRKLENSWRDLLVPIERLDLNDTASVAAVEREDVPRQAASFVTFSSNPKDMKRWELSADVRVVTPLQPGKSGGVVEANLQSLARDFGACMAIPLLYGRDFLDRNPQLLDDFWKFDNDLFPMLMIGVPTWAPFKMIKEGRIARSRILAALEALCRRIDQCQRGKYAGSEFDMSDVNVALFERNKVYEREGWSFPERGAGDFAVFWGQNANTQAILFWLLAYVYSTPALLDRVREEIAPYIRLSPTSPPEIISMDLPALSRNCQLLKASIFETYCMANEPMLIAPRAALGRCRP